MNNCYYGDFGTFMLDNDNRVYRMWQYKKYWTPWEEKHCEELESNYVDAQCSFIVIRESIELPDGDILLGVQEVCFDCYNELNIMPKNTSMNYYKLSEISLSYVYSDQFDYKEG